MRSTASPAQWFAGMSGNEDCANAPLASTAARSVMISFFMESYPLNL